MERHSQVTLTHTRELQNDTHGVQFITKHTLNQAHITIPTERLMKTSRKIHITQGTNYTCFWVTERWDDQGISALFAYTNKLLTMTMYSFALGIYYVILI